MNSRRGCIVILSLLVGGALTKEAREKFGMTVVASPNPMNFPHPFDEYETLGHYHYASAIPDQNSNSGENNQGNTLHAAQSRKNSGPADSTIQINGQEMSKQSSDTVRDDLGVKSREHALDSLKSGQEKIVDIPIEGADETLDTFEVDEENPSTNHVSTPNVRPDDVSPSTVSLSTLLQGIRDLRLTVGEMDEKLDRLIEKLIPNNTKGNPMIRKGVAWFNKLRHRDSVQGPAKMQPHQTDSAEGKNHQTMRWMNYFRSPSS
ncbi:unnamed protein product [Bemisia tabaci]|uniref:Uncharacterized protein n=1 Tax=Bemisia tabaci TaxID=7038 RepID=A0A9P0A542_BEMTA|nr:unnamed protein product [Bemisia tabaci]